MLGLRKFLATLNDLPEETPIEPELKTNANKERDREIKEQQDLRAGAVLQAVTQQGQGNDTPNDGDLVYVHYSVLNEEHDILYTTWAEEGGSGQPLVFVLGKGSRAPRAWELSVLDMTRNMRKQLKVQPSYGYKHPDCGMQPPPGVQPDQTLQFVLQLCSWYPAKKVRVLGDESSTFKYMLRDSSKWEVARPPNEVVFSQQLSCPAYDGAQGTGRKLSSVSADNPCRAQLGSGLLPAGLEAALCSMSKGEKAVFVIPAAEMRPEQPSSSSNSKQQSGLSIPELPAKCAQVEATIELLDLVQVRDVTGDSGVLKRRLQEGDGEFPVDCPLHDTTVRLHYRVRSLAGGKPGPWVYDTRSRSTDTAASSSNGNSAGSTAAAAAAAAGEGSSAPGSSAGSSAPPLEVDTGCGELPEGLELVVKLMVPGELASATCTPHYAFEAYDPPAGISAVDPVEFEVLLVSFHREGYWQNMDWQDRWALADRLKEKGNALFKDKKYKFATNKYTHLLRLIESTRDFEEQEQVERADTIKAALTSNLALAAFNQEEYVRCIEWCDKTLQADPNNAKVVFRRGKALSMKGDHEEADEFLAAAAEMDPSLAAEVEAARAANKQREKAAATKQKQQFRNFFAKS